MIKQITLHGRQISYDLQRKKVKNINIRIKSDGRILVSAAPAVKLVTVEQTLLSKADRILAALARCERLAESRPLPLQYVDGERILIQGQPIPLRIVLSDKNGAVLREGVFEIHTRDPQSTALKKSILDQWYRAYCSGMITEICRYTHPKFAAAGVAFPKEIRFRLMKSRWGSCIPQRGVLTFNIALAKVPLACAEYVVAHEFTHFLQANHSKLFYRELAMRMPDWKTRQTRLHQLGKQILH